MTRSVLNRIVSVPTNDARCISFDFAVDTATGTVPGAAWLPASFVPRALVLVGHGGSQHKRHDSVTTLASRLVRDSRFAVAAIDGPVHGARANDASLAPKARQRQFLGLWEQGDGRVPAMTADWQATLDALLGSPEVGNPPVGYAGISMGTAYGLPLLASERRIEAAVIGMWGADYPCSDRLVSAAREVRIPTLFIARMEDEIFGAQGVRDLFDALAGNDKRMLILPGKHVETAEQFDETAFFLARRIPFAGNKESRP